MANLHGSGIVTPENENQEYLKATTPTSPVLPAKTKRKRHDGTNPDDYKWHKRWSFRLWAWQFLRRNTAYQAACDNLKNLTEDIEGEKSQIAAKFGLKRYKSYREGYSTNERPIFVVGSFAIRSNFSAADDESHIVRMSIAPGAVAVRFDLQAMLDGSFGLESQLRYAKEKINEIVTRLAADYQPPPHRVIKRVHANKLLEYILMLDHRSKGATQLDCDLLVNPAKKKRLEDCTSPNTKESERANAKNKLNEAVYMTTHGYLALATRLGRPVSNQEEQVVS
jgi:hypothetical protein